MMDNAIRSYASLLALVLMVTACQSPPPMVAATPAASPTFTDVTEAAGLKEAGNLLCAWADYDNDGDVDLLVSGKLFRNNGDATFTEITTEVGGPFAGNATWADFDNDGHLDFYAIGDEGELFRNNGNGWFDPTPIPRNKYDRARGAAWADIDNDSFVDLYVSNHEDWLGSVPRPYPDVMFRNNGDGTFAEPWQSPPGEIWCGRGINFADFDDDGDQDAFVSNYRIMPNVLFVNDGDGNFTNLAEERGVKGNPDGPGAKVGKTQWAPEYDVYGHTIGACWGDLNSDGAMDLLVVNFSHNWMKGQDHPHVYINSGYPDYTFTDLNHEDKAGIYWQESYAKGALGDYDNDGDLDLYMTTVYGGDHCELYENDGTGKFKPVGKEKGLHEKVTYQVGWADYDNDGDLDLMTHGKLFQNGGNSNHWLKVKVTGGNGTNAAAIGSRVRISYKDKVQIREVSGGNSGNQNPLTVHFGLGDYGGPVRVEVFFPSGLYLKHETPVDTALTLSEHNASRPFFKPRKRR